MMLLKEAEISVVCLIILTFIAVRYYSRANRKKEGAAGGVFMLVVAFSFIHLAADGIIRITVGDPTTLSAASMDKMTFLYYSLYIVGMIGALQSAVDCILINADTKKSIAGWAFFNVPAACLAGISMALVDKIGMPLIRYSSLFYAIVLFVFVAWFYERIESDLRRGLICMIVVCVAFFVVYFVLNLVIVPPSTSMILLSVCFSTLLIRESEVKKSHAQIRAEKKAEKERREKVADKVKLQKDPLTGTDLEEAKKIRDMKDELGLGVTALLDMEGIKAVLDEEGFDEDESVDQGSSVDELFGEDEEITEEGINEDEIEEPEQKPEESSEEQETIEEYEQDEEEVENEIFEVEEKLADMLEYDSEEDEEIKENIEYDVPEEVETDEAETEEDEDEVEVEEDITIEEFEEPEILEPEPTRVEVLEVPKKEEIVIPAVKPLILDKDLMDKYVVIRGYIDQKQYNKVKEGIDELDEYRMSGIQLMRFGKIRRLTNNEEWDELAAELDK
ncbi:MAG: hypothetical protein K5639_06160 [Eubacterium sp.]|nr:hypothetical protein [Eubacterium sp.]